MGIIHHLHPSNLPPRPMMQPAQLNLRKYKPNLADRSVSERHRRAIWGDLTTHNFMSLASSRFRKRSRPGGWCWLPAPPCTSLGSRRCPTIRKTVQSNTAKLPVFFFLFTQSPSSNDRTEKQALLLKSKRLCKESKSLPWTEWQQSTVFSILRLLKWVDVVFQATAHPWSPFSFLYVWCTWH